MSFTLVLVAAGSSQRMGRDKLLEELCEVTVAERSLCAFFKVADVTEAVVVTNNDMLKQRLCGIAVPKTVQLKFVQGGQTRAESVKNGLEAVSNPYVLIHDGARPFVSKDLIERVVLGVKQYGSSIPCLPLYDSVRQVDGDQVVGIADRDKLFRVQTPQGFETATICAAYQNAYGNTDESAILLEKGIKPHQIEGDEANRKITKPQDVFGVGVRVGNGFDVHKLVAGRKLILGGVTVPAPFGEEAHSDGDVLLHAVMDAVLSAAGERDIGNLFPDNDPQYRGISSVELLKRVVQIVADKGRILTGISAVVALQSPKLATYIPQMVQNIKEITAAPFVNVAATTTEHLGIVGDGGIAASAVVTLF